jgi:hypothetical protein
LYVCFEMGSYYIAQPGLKCLGSHNPLALNSWISGLKVCAPCLCFLLFIWNLGKLRFEGKIGFSEAMENSQEHHRNRGLERRWMWSTTITEDKNEEATMGPGPAVISKTIPLD